MPSAMSRLLISGALACVLVPAVAHPGLAADAPAAQSPASQLGEGIASAVPPGVAELVTGGSWDDGEAHGSYRVIVVEIGSAERSISQVYLQWIRAGTTAGPSATASIVATLPIVEFNELKRANASIQLDDGVDGEAQIYITSTEAVGTSERQMRIYAALPGRYSVIATESSASPPQQPAPGPAAPSATAAPAPQAPAAPRAR